MQGRISKRQNLGPDAASAAAEGSVANRRRRTFRRGIPRLWIAAAVFAALVLVRIGYDRWRGDSRPSAHLPLAEGLYDVVRIVDGDTLDLRLPSSTERAEPKAAEGVRFRLLGIDCPEIAKPDYPAEPWAREAATYTAKFVAGQPVQLRFDKRRIDMYGTYLAYISVDGQMLNEQLLRFGLARASIFPGDSGSVARRLRAAEQEARDDHRGIWSAR